MISLVFTLHLFKCLTMSNQTGVPIALCCIAPILAAKVFGSKGVEITLGRKGDESKWPYGGALDAAKSFGANVVEKNVNEVILAL
jgi:enhancing lycopene biosynthesis protein 2